MATSEHVWSVMNSPLGSFSWSLVYWNLWNTLKKCTSRLLVLWVGSINRVQSIWSKTITYLTQTRSGIGSWMCHRWMWSVFPAGKGMFGWSVGNTFSLWNCRIIQVCLRNRNRCGLPAPAESDCVAQVVDWWMKRRGSRTKELLRGIHCVSALLN